jgi:hypothetical protein
MLRGHEKIALVLAIFVIHDHDHAAALQLLDDFAGRTDCHALCLEKR